MKGVKVFLFPGGNGGIWRENNGGGGAASEEEENQAEIFPSNAH